MLGAVACCTYSAAIAYLRSIGADEFIDYTQGPFEEKVKNVDVVIDTVGADTAERAFKTIRRAVISSASRLAT